MITLAVFNWLATRPFLRDKLISLLITGNILGKSSLISLFESISKPWPVLGLSLEHSWSISWSVIGLKIKLRGEGMPRKSWMEVLELGTWCWSFSNVGAFHDVGAFQNVGAFQY